VRGGRETQRTLKATSVISWKPSESAGRWYRDVKPVKATLGRRLRFSGFICVSSSASSGLTYSVSVDRDD